MASNNKQRPINLDLATIHFPIAAIISILHRISGVLIFLAIPLLLVMLQQSLRSEQSYAALSECLQNAWFKIALWVLCVGVVYHLVAGCRHLLLDVGIGETQTGGRRGAWWVVGLTVLIAIVLGIKLW